MCCCHLSSLTGVAKCIDRCARLPDRTFQALLFKRIAQKQLPTGAVWVWAGLRSLRAGLAALKVTHA